MTTRPSALFYLTCVLSISGTHCFAPASHSMFITNAKVTDKSLSMGLLDDLKLIFSDEGRENRKAFEEKEKEEQEALQREILMRRANPEKMQEYRNDVTERRTSLTEERELWNFQQANSKEDPLETWNALREEGKIKVGSDLERDPDSSRLGSEGLIGVRIDERMPYIDQGYVDEEADEKGNFLDIFGKKKDEGDSP